MAVYNSYVVQYRASTSNLSWTTISNVQELSCQVGRVLPVDQWRPSSAVIRIRYPTGFSSPPAGLGIDAQIRFFCPSRSSTKPTWTGFVRNLSVEVGIPWVTATSTGNADFLVIECEGAIATTSRQKPIATAITQNYSIKSMLQSWYQPYALANTNVGVSTSSADIEGLLGTFFAAESLNTDAAIQRFAGTYQVRVIDGIRKSWGSADPTKIESWGFDDAPSWFVNTGQLVNADIATVTLSDTTNNATNRQYNDITFDSLADGYLTASVVQTLGGYNYEGSSSTTIDKSQTFIGVQWWSVLAGVIGTPISPDVGQRAANYWANAFNTPTIAPLAISATTAGQDTQNLDTLGFTDLELGYLPTKAVNITLRGNTYLCRIEGVQLTADLNQSRFTYYISPTDITGWFILDSADLGVLDQNKLGLY